MLRPIMFFSLFAGTLCHDRPSRIVHLLQGPVKGYKDLEEDIFAFYSIPYATAPTGPDRFKAPLPPPVWFETLEAVDKKIICPQNNHAGFILETKEIKEDCLIANVLVPETDVRNLPVVVHVHGGAFITGWGELFTTKKLASSKKVITVTFNYRLGAHGFLCLGTKDVPGNAGMKDQVTLLRWVKNNIASFGGDPDDVTLSGFSAGSSSIDLLLLSKTTDGLFQRVILESGANVSPFSVQQDPIKNAKEYAKLLKFDNADDFYALEDFYKIIPYEKLNSVNTFHRADSSFLMSPCVERDVGAEVFLEDSPANILKSGNFKKMPMLYGFADMEGIFRMLMFENWMHKINEKFSDFLPCDLRFKNENEKQIVAERIKRFYFGNDAIDTQNILTYINYFSDILVTYPILRSVKYQIEAENNAVYLYEYSFVPDDTPAIPFTNIRGATHCAQTFGVLDGYWNGTILSEKNVPEDLKEMKKVMREIWLNFMTTGKPVVEDSKLPAWPPVKAKWSPHMSLNKTIQLRGPLLQERAVFWEDIYEKYYYFPVLPTPPPRHSEL